MRKNTIKRLAAISLAALLAMSVYACRSDEEGGVSVAGVWQSPPVSGHTEGFIYQFTNDNRILSSLGGFLYTGGTYEVKGGTLKLINYPTYHIETANNNPIVVINYGNELECDFALTENGLQLSVSGASVTWTKADTVVPTPTPTPTPPPVPTEPPTPPPEVSKITVLWDSVPLPFGNEFSQAAGTEDSRFSLEIRPDGIVVDFDIISDNEDVFIVEKIDVEGVPTAFRVTAVAAGNANLIVTAGNVREAVFVRITEP